MKSILFIRGGALGDFILTLPAFQAVRNRFPEARMEVMGYTHIASLANNRSLVQAVRSIEHRTVAGFFAARGDLDPELSAYFASFEVVVSWLYDPDSIFSGNLVRAGVRRLIRADGTPTRDKHAILHLSGWLRELGIKEPVGDPRIEIPPEWRANSSERLKGVSWPRVVIHIGSGAASKRWPVERFVELVGWMKERGIRPLMVLGPADLEPQREFFRHIQESDVVCLENEPLPVLAGVMDQGTVFLGHDSGVSHLAAAVGVPSVVLFGPTDPLLWAPKGRDVVLIRKGTDLHSVSVEDVKTALEPRLKNRQG